MVHKERLPAGRTYNVDRIISVGRDRETGGSVIRLKDADGRTIALRLWNRQLRTLARGTSGLMTALSGDGDGSPALNGSTSQVRNVRPDRRAGEAQL